jgi:hypothetical protein
MQCRSSFPKEDKTAAALEKLMAAAVFSTLSVLLNLIFTAAF